MIRTRIPNSLRDRRRRRLRVWPTICRAVYISANRKPAASRGSIRKGNIETLAEGYQGKKFNAPNDIVVRRDGHVYFTDPAFGSANDRRELDFYGIWHMTPKGEIWKSSRSGKTRPNGIALSADGKVLVS